jgi:hypothetical protein
MSEVTIARRAIPSRKAAESYDEAEEAEDFQAIGMRCQETLIQHVRALAKPEMVPAGEAQCHRHVRDCCDAS